MKVVGSNLCSVCQQLFSLSKEEANDEILIKESIAGEVTFNASHDLHVLLKSMYMYCTCNDLLLSHTHKLK